MSGRDAGAQLPIVARTRRAIRIANETRREQGERGRRTFGISLFARRRHLLRAGAGPVGQPG